MIEATRAAQTREKGSGTRSYTTVGQCVQGLRDSTEESARAASKAFVEGKAPQKQRHEFLRCVAEHNAQKERFLLKFMT